jgi:hypothetical protein
MVRFVCAAILAATAGCNPPPKLTAEELVGALKSAGYEVTERNRLHPSSQGADYAYELEVDYRPVTAWRFETPSKATLWATSNAGGFSVGCWAFQYADSVTAQKVRAALAPR